ncbi:hypothetical protein SAMN02910413_1221 [Pseudobutyrivibrio sp. C4]|uniref:hypothetical protein n=1 Tax=Pseudobutyrivibrio sp. C4 TaxID=1520803 RepID=UPI0008B8A870|nr:hypothetical protein [Pseudobutyrivibrio sp. C4]SES91183.1 hypothetical protein SAMN02910413_1221 [Pseudobutyrivibrio sp. C4]
MLSLIFSVMMLIVFGKLLGLAIRASWTVLKVVFTLVFLPLILIGMCIAGMFYIAIPVLIVIGIISLIASSTT